MRSTNETRRRLHRLATGTAHDGGDAITAAEAALESVRATARFCDDDGEARLRAAVSDAVRAGEQRRVRRGRAALETLCEFRRAVAGESSAGIEKDERGGREHFHSARGTVLPGAGQRRDR